MLHLMKILFATVTIITRILISFSKGGAAMKQQESILYRFAEISDLPGETLPKLPLVEIAGDRRVLIENHKGVTELGCDRICVKVPFGNVEINGKGMSIVHMTQHQLVISGKIDYVKLIRKE